MQYRFIESKLNKTGYIDENKIIIESIKQHVKSKKKNLLEKHIIIYLKLTEY